MNHTDQSRSAISGRIKHKLDRAVRLDSAVQELIDNQISPRQIMFDSIDKLWDELLPAELTQHCKIADISGGLLKVMVDSPPYVHELRLCSPELLRELQKRCSQARIKKIKFILA